MERRGGHPPWQAACRVMRAERCTVFIRQSSLENGEAKDVLVTHPGNLNLRYWRESNAFCSPNAFCPPSYGFECELCRRSFAFLRKRAPLSTRYQSARASPATAPPRAKRLTSRMRTPTSGLTKRLTGAQSKAPPASWPRRYMRTSTRRVFPLFLSTPVPVCVPYLLVCAGVGPPEVFRMCAARIPLGGILLPTSYFLHCQNSFGRNRRPSFSSIDQIARAAPSGGNRVIGCIQMINKRGGPFLQERAIT